MVASSQTKSHSKEIELNPYLDSNSRNCKLQSNELERVEREGWKDGVKDGVESEIGGLVIAETAD